MTPAQRACSPEVIEGLLDDLDALERGSSIARQWHDANVAEIAELKGRIATLEARAKRLRKALETFPSACDGMLEETYEGIHMGGIVEKPEVSVHWNDALKWAAEEIRRRLRAALAEPDARGTGGHE